MSSPSDQEPTRPNAQALTRLPNGEWVSVFDQLEKESKVEAQISTALLRSGDLVAMQFEKEDGATSGLTFEVETSDWSGLGAAGGFGPDTRLVGKLEGAEIPEDVINKKVTFIGSGWGGSMRETGVIATGRSPYFASNEGVFQSPFITTFGVFRRDSEGDLRSLEPTEIDAEARNTAPNHHERLVQVEKLMKLFGFDEPDFRDGSKALDRNTVYEDGRLIANYEAGMAMGNQLAVYDKQTGHWIEFKYYNFKNQDTLQVAYADLPPQKKEEVFITGRLVEESGIHASGEAITTFTTSSRYGIDAINYKPSMQQAVDVLHVPLVDRGYVPRPNFQVKMGNQIAVREEYWEAKQPGLLKELGNEASAMKNQDGTTTLSIKDSKVLISNPDAELQKLINILESSKTQDVSAKRLGKIVGRFIRRGNS